jgi:hypothetical protein
MDGKNEAAIKILKFLIMIQIENGNDKNLVWVDTKEINYLLILNESIVFFWLYIIWYQNKKK